MDQPFLFIGGHLCLDLLNTKKRGPTGEIIDLLATPECLREWWEAAGLVPVAVDAALLDSALELREAIRTLVVAGTNGEVPVLGEPLAVVNRVLATGARRHQLSPTLAGQEESVGIPGPLLPLAEAALDLLTRHDLSLVRQCAGSGCVLWFLDTTKNKRRRWCRMEVCGNRAKVSAHYHRIHGEHEA